MKSRTFGMKALTACLFLALASDANSAPRQPPSYPLICQGGGGMKFSINVGEVRRGRQGTEVIVFFRRAPYAASQKQPGPGECAWVDRPLNSHEPLKFRSSVVAQTISVDATGDRITNFRARGLLANPTTQLINAVMRGGLLQVMVYNERGGGYLRVTQISPAQGISPN